MACLREDDVPRPQFALQHIAHRPERRRALPTGDDELGKGCGPQHRERDPRLPERALIAQEVHVLHERRRQRAGERDRQAVQFEEAAQKRLWVLRGVGEVRDHPLVEGLHSRMVTRQVKGPRLDDGERADRLRPAGRREQRDQSAEGDAD